VVHRDYIFPELSGGQVKNLSLQKHSGLPFRHFWQLSSLLHFEKLNEVFSTAVSNINPLLGAMGLVLTRLSRSSNTLKEVPCGWSC